MINNIVSLNSIKSTDELINMYRQGYIIDNLSGNMILQSKSPSQNILTTDISTIGIAIVSILIGSLVYYKVGKWEAKKLGWDK